MRHDDKLPENIGLGITVGIIATVMIFIGIAWLLWQIPIPAKLIEFTVHLKYWAALKINDLAPPLLQSTADIYRHYLDVVKIGSWPFLWRFNMAFSIAAITGGYIGYLVGKPEPANRHVKGRQLWRGEEGIKRLSLLSAKECKREEKTGLAMHSVFKWRLSFDRETRHFMLIGSSGGGKTQILIPLIRAAIARNDRMVIYDVKGDFTRWLPNLVLLAPWDARSHAWDVAKDCRNSQDAKQLAARLIPSGHDPVWHSAARQLLTALLLKLQAEMGNIWSWQDFFNLVCLDEKQLLDIVQKYLPEAIHTVNAPGRTTQSVLINFGAHMSLISDLAKAWGKMPAERRFSFRQWLQNGKTPNRIVVLQGSGDHEELAQAYIQGIMALVTGFINSPGFPDSKGRRIWFFLDEFPQIGELKQAAPLLAVGRSKGIRVVLAAQDIHQIKAIYGEHVASTWMSSAGTMIISRIQAGATANFIAKEVIGYKKIDRIVMHKGERQAPIREDVLVVEPSELESDLGCHGDAVSAILLGYGDAFVLRWTITKFEKSDLLRKASEEAQWLKPVCEQQPIGEAPAQSSVSTGTDGLEFSHRRPRLALRPMTEAELLAMAETGTPTTQAAEPLESMADDATGGNHESR